MHEGAGAGRGGIMSGLVDAPASRWDGVKSKWERMKSWLKGFCPAHKGSQQTELQPKSADPISVQFCREVNKASRLLNFLIEEGHPYHIPDQIIDNIEAARTLANEPTPPPPEERAKLLKAYRDLVAIPGTSVTFDFPPAPFWQSRWRGAFLLAALGVPIISFLIMLFYPAWRPHWYFAVGFALVSALIIWGLYVFTGIVTNRKLNHIIAFCYLFTGIVLVASILPWWMPGLFPGKVGNVPVGIFRGCAGPDIPPEVPKGVTCGDKNNNSYQWVLNIGGVIEEPAQKVEPPSYVIRGGLVVPLYVLVLALIGGAVSMTRRVPEYQRRAMSSQDPFTNQQARESLVFQIMQVFSAPLIAIAAYYIIQPTTSMSAVVLGFGSGFASEPILLMIRGLVEKLSPAAPPQAAPMNVRVNPPTKVLQPGESHQFTAHVSGSPSSEVTWLMVPSDAGSISQSGYYTAPPESGKTVTITACSVADRTKSGSASVTVKRAETPSRDAHSVVQQPSGTGGTSS
jgi:hypothetical protein